jgi:hypothetical protein
VCGKFSAAAVIETGRVAARVTTLLSASRIRRRKGVVLSRYLPSSSSSSSAFLIRCLASGVVAGFGLASSPLDRHDRAQYLGFVLGSQS